MGCGASSSNVSSVNQSQSRSPSSSPPRGMDLPLVSRPLSLPERYPHGSPITQGELNNRRSEFWSTRTDNDAQMWMTLRSVSEALLDQDLVLANAILEASSLLTPQGNLEVVYDERGRVYKVPRYCFAIPLELSLSPVESASFNPPTTTSGKGGNASQKSDSKKTVSGGEGSGRGGNSSGGGGGQSMQLKVRINPGDYTLTVPSDSLSSILQLKRQICGIAERDLSHLFVYSSDTVSLSSDGRQPINPERQRVIYLGRQLPDHIKVSDAKIEETTVVQVFLRPLPTKK